MLITLPCSIQTIPRTGSIGYHGYLQSEMKCVVYHCHYWSLLNITISTDTPLYVGQMTDTKYFEL